jgi:hypothetical protein
LNERPPLIIWKEIHAQLMKTLHPNISIVADGSSRLHQALRGTAQDRRRRYEELLAELESQHQDSSQRAGFFQRMVLRYRISREARAIVRREFGLPSSQALFFSAP